MSKSVVKNSLGLPRLSLSAINKAADVSAKEKTVARQQLVAELQNQEAGELAPLFNFPEGGESISQKNCENLIGSIQLPVGVAGPMPLRLAGETIESVMVPLATTEGALVASVSRGCKALRLAGGAAVQVEYVGMSRAPVFACQSGLQAKKLEQWFLANRSLVASWMEETSNHLTLRKIQSWVRGRYVFVRFVCDTDQAMGMNMVSIAVQTVWLRLQALLAKGDEADLAGVKMISLSSNVCSDKKAGAVNGLLGRGYWGQAEVMMSEEIVASSLKTTIDSLVETHNAKNYVGSALAGSLAQNMQVANVVAALFAATGQDLAHVVDASQAVTILEVVDNPELGGKTLYASVTIPSLPLGVVGGGTWLPAQAAARKIMGFGDGMTAHQLAGVVAAAALAGELSGMAALSSNQLACAHQALGRQG